MGTPMVPASAPRPEDVGISTTTFNALKKSCMDMKNYAYCPYSHFRVGASILLKSGRVITGANVENASYPVTICAERVALGTAVANHGLKRGDVRAVGIATDLDEPASPCGMCRQALREFCDLNVPIVMHTKSGRSLTKTLGELLPLSFGPDTLPPQPKPKKWQAKNAASSARNPVVKAASAPPPTSSTPLPTPPNTDIPQKPQKSKTKNSHHLQRKPAPRPAHIG